MKLSEFKQYLPLIPELNFVQLDGNLIPKHFHITEAGLTTKKFIDCGGTFRTEKYVSFQIWIANDFDHRITPQKVLTILHMAERLFEQEDPEVEIEYQTETISRYGLDFDGHTFILQPKQTDCLAKDQCGISPEKQKVKLSELQTTQASCCKAGDTCC